MILAMHGCIRYLPTDLYSELKMALKFRLRGLAETFVEEVVCPCCGHSASTSEPNKQHNSHSDDDKAESGLKTEHTKVTLSGIVVVVQCGGCEHVFIPRDQRLGVLNHQKLHDAVERDSKNTGQPIFKGLPCVSMEVERINAYKVQKFH
jgi:hypothetical protein